MANRSVNSWAVAVAGWDSHGALAAKVEVSISPSRSISSLSSSACFRILAFSGVARVCVESWVAMVGALVSRAASSVRSYFVPAAGQSQAHHRAHSLRSSLLVLLGVMVSRRHASPRTIRRRRSDSSTVATLCTCPRRSQQPRFPPGPRHPSLHRRPRLRHAIRHWR
jgi:hypothetical protein